MTLVVSSSLSTATPASAGRRATLSPRMAQGLVLAAVTAAALTAALLIDPAAAARAAAQAEPGLTGLLRGMAAIKAAMALAALGGVVWRLRMPAPATWVAAYALAGAAMAAGPVLIWAIAPLVAGAALLHAGLAATLVLLWRDPAVSRSLSGLIAARRARIAGR
jgi:hypothetical protein